jgi:hypothetical protein
VQNENVVIEKGLFRSNEFWEEWVHVTMVTYGWFDCELSHELKLWVFHCPLKLGLGLLVKEA